MEKYDAIRVEGDHSAVLFSARGLTTAEANALALESSEHSWFYVFVPTPKEAE